VNLAASAPLCFDGRHYDEQNKQVTDDIPFFLRQAKKYGEPILELACGTGRVTIPLAEAGMDIVGLDVHSSMLEHARKKAAAKGVAVEWVQADCRDFRLGKKFKTIIFPFNTISVLFDLESIEACLSCVRKHLLDDGRFIVHFFNARFDYLTRNPSERFPVAEYPDPNGNGQVVVTESNVYDTASQINHIKWYYRFENQPDEHVEELNMRIFFPQELDALLHYNGFVIDAKYGDYDETPFESRSLRQLIVCRKR
jgi:SAM-dependent methyltransferase